MASKPLQLMRPSVWGRLSPLLRAFNILRLLSLPTVAKWLVYLVFLINARSWPLMWHNRVFKPVFQIQLAYRLVLLRSIFKSPKARSEAIERWFDSITQVGAHPFEYTVHYHTWASIDDSDFNGHLSNSSYAKTLDCIRMKSALAFFPQFFRAGGWMPLGATHFSFIREIPMFASYEIRMSIASWDQKWFYVLAKFVSKPKGGKKAQRRGTNIEQMPTPLRLDSVFHASLSTPADTASTPDLLLPSVVTPPETSLSGPSKDLHAVASALASSATATTESDGSIVHTVAVSVCCFKLGRITVPPGLVIALHGFADAPSATTTATIIDGPVSGSRTVSTGEEAYYSRSNPPPHWHIAKSIMSAPEGGSMKKLREFLKGGWRDVTEGQRWWDAALGGGVEETRVKRLEVVRSLVPVMSGAREL